ncbi:MAG TPA: NAD(P)/FAD-dependent oxidoreductase [Trebonia sp.]|jgi:NADPH-dependent 2,4-dienoyl-CoA reductase/sulfur reductase-like enzyme
MTRVAVIGAGPAGLSAANAALEAGADVVLLDVCAGLGGQFWRHLPASRPAAREALLHHGWDRFTVLRDALTGSERCRVVTGAQVWAIDRGPGDRADGAIRLHLAIGDPDGPDRTMEALAPDAVVLATGAHDHTLPFPGWDLPGVVTGGAAQALAKAERVAIGERVIVAGSGPFLLPVAASLTATGARVLGVHEASRLPVLAAGWLRGAGTGRTARALAAMPGKLGELAGYAAVQYRNRVPYRPGTAVIAAHGRDRVESVTVADLDANWAPVPGTERVIACDAVAVSHGFTPRLELAIAAGCALTGGASVNGALAEAGPFDRFVAVDGDQRTSVTGVYAAGEITGIGGADAARHEGALAGWLAAGGSPGSAAARNRRTAIARYRVFARALAAAHGIRPGWRQWLTGDTLVCRCEEVTRARLTATANATQARGLRSLKLTTRAGLGPCQGRVCGRTVEALLTGDGARPFLDGVIPDRRPLAAPLRFSELARSPQNTQAAPAPHERHLP